jgi:hypothetical protein
MAIVMKTFALAAKGVRKLCHRSILHLSPDRSDPCGSEELTIMSRFAYSISEQEERLSWGKAKGAA